MSLNEISKNLSINTKVEVLEQLNTILDSSEANVSFWGTRKIAYNGEQISFSELARKVSLASNICRKNGLDELQREQWIYISQKISTFYDKSDAAVKNRNFLTRFFVAIREFTFNPYTQRFYYEENIVEQNFRSYSNEEFDNLKKTFGGVDIDIWGEPFPIIDLSGNLTKIVTEEAIRKKAQMDRLRLSKA